MCGTGHCGIRSSGTLSSVVPSRAVDTLLDLAREARGARREQPAPGGLISGVCEAPQNRKVSR
jgi:hypothetical protein